MKVKVKVNGVMLCKQEVLSLFAAILLVNNSQRAVVVVNEKHRHKEIGLPDPAAEGSHLSHSAVLG